MKGWQFGVGIAILVAINLLIIFGLIPDDAPANPGKTWAELHSGYPVRLERYEDSEVICIVASSRSNGTVTLDCQWKDKP